jgi:glutamine phosphoribosylpyrophosphate amidotransferase
LLARITDAPQTGRPFAVRRDGVVFTACGAAPPVVLLVDDVATTGATLRAAARTLREAGARRVLAATVARTPPPWGRGTSRAYTPPR